MTSSVRAKMMEVEKEKKIATRQREESSDNKLQHQKASVGGVSAKASSGDSIGGVEKVRARTEKATSSKTTPAPQRTKRGSKNPKSLCKEKSPSQKESR